MQITSPWTSRSVSEINRLEPYRAGVPLRRKMTPFAASLEPTGLRLGAVEQGLAVPTLGRSKQESAVREIRARRAERNPARRVRSREEQRPSDRRAVSGLPAICALGDD